MTIAQFFEVQAKQGQVEQYLDLAASLRPALSEMGGCLFIDRFKSLTRDNLLLSYQIWLDEGQVEGILVLAFDVTDIVLARRATEREHANERLARNEKLSIDVPYTKDEVTKRVPKAFSAAAKELVDPKTIDIRTPSGLKNSRAAGTPGHLLKSISGRIGSIRTNRPPRAHGERPNDNRPSLDATGAPA